MSLNSFFVNVESMDENIDEKKNIYLSKKKMSFRNHFEKLKSKNSPIFEEKIPLITNLESQTSNELIEKIKLIDLQSLKLNQNDVFAISYKSNSQSSLKQNKTSQNKNENF